MTTWEWRMGRLVDAKTDDDVLVLADWFDVDQQDATLIAATPVMLNTLVVLSAWLKMRGRHSGRCVGGDDCVCGLTVIRSSVEDAIAKAGAA